ncbi:MAG: AI-2E family transporter [Candidatus Woesearchaeota archaeon]
MHTHAHRKKIATVIIVVLTAFVLYAMSDFLTAIFSALILFVLTKGPYNYLVRKRKWNSAASAAVIMVLSALIILLPLITIGTIAANQAFTVLEKREVIFNMLEGFVELLAEFNLTQEAESILANMAVYIQQQLLNIVGNATKLLLNITIMYFLLYYLLGNQKSLRQFFIEFVPFSKVNSQKLLEKFATVTNALIISSGTIAVLQGLLLGLGFWIAGFDGWVFWGLLGALLSFLPVVGPFLLWIPASVFLFVTDNTGMAIFLIIWGLILSNVDNVLRPILSERVGKIHPLITLLGVFMGLQFFGILGIIIGPLILSYFFTLWYMYEQEYLQND